MTSRALAVGIDIGVARSSLVVLDSERSIVASARITKAAEIEQYLQPRTQVIAIDSPPAWAPSGARSRPGERALAAAPYSIRCFATPDRGRGASHPFYAWMEVGFAFHRRARRTAIPVLEVFPNATAIRLGGRARPDETKRQWRRRVLRTAGVSDGALASIDDVDAALCALTGLLWCTGDTETLAGELTIPR